MRRSDNFLEISPIGDTDVDHLPVPNLAEAIAFYETCMGFAVELQHKTPYRSATLHRDNIRIGLSENGGDPEQASCYISVNDVKLVHKELRHFGVAVSEIRVDEREGGKYQVCFVKDPDGLCYCLGQPRRILKIVPHNPRWSARYQKEAENLKEIFGQEYVSMHHIGSTSIPSIKAKPVIDILIEVRDLEKIETFDDDMIALGYYPRGDESHSRRLYYNKNTNGVRTHQVHVLQTDHPDFVDLVNFKDYLIGHPQEAEIYSRLKEGLTQKYPEDIANYIKGKGAFVKEILRKARIWRTQT